MHLVRFLFFTMAYQHLNLWRISIWIFYILSESTEIEEKNNQIFFT